MTPLALALLAMLVAASPEQDATASPTSAPSPMPASACADCPLFAPGESTSTRVPLILGIVSGVAAGTIESQAQSLRGSTGLAFKVTGKPLALLGGAGLLALIKGGVHQLEEPPVLGTPGHRSPPPPGIDDAVRTWTTAHASLGTRRAFDKLSYFTLGHLAGQPLGVFGGGDKRKRRWNDVIVPYEAALVTGFITTQVKHLVHRVRPFAYYCEPQSAKDYSSQDAQLSFFSGHTAVAFALAASSSRVASVRGFKDAKRIRHVSYGIAALTGAFRIGADKHYATDVAVGGGLGWLIGKYLAKWQTVKSDGPVASQGSSMNFSVPIAGGVVQIGAGGGFSIMAHFAR